LPDLKYIVKAEIREYPCGPSSITIIANSHNQDQEGLCNDNVGNYLYCTLLALCEKYNKYNQKDRTWEGKYIAMTYQNVMSDCDGWSPKQVLG
jgi:hypothetical protein